MKKYDLFFGYFGNGCSVSNRAVMEHGDYKKVCHISDDGETITIYDKSIPADVMEKIREHAERMKIEYKAKQETDRIAAEKYAEWLENRMSGTEEQPKTEDLSKFNESSYYNCEDIAEKLTDFSGIEDNKIKEKLINSIYNIKAMAANPYNSDEWRILYNVLLKVAEME